MGSLDPVVADALKRQITTERQNSAIYAALSNGFAVLNLPGMAKFCHRNSKEELTHADKIRDYLIDRYNVPVIDALSAVTMPQADMLHAPYVFFELALKAEQSTTESILTIYALSEDVPDPQTCRFLQWFLKEQTKSEREFAGLSAQALFAQGCPAAILKMDHDLGKKGK